MINDGHDLSLDHIRRSQRQPGSLHPDGSVKPCPFCGSAVRVQTHGIACDGCGLWYGAGSLAVDRWRELHGTPLAPIPRDVSWLVEVWNLRAALRSAADAVPISAPPVTKEGGR